ncbi:MAG: glycosyltransferase [Thermodesulfovibrionales bacterium]|nr:glycosyltransferase [Thermodesulfovibrionales bacterium]
MDKDLTKKELLVKGIKVLKTQGWRALLQKVNKKILFNKSIKITPLSLDINCLQIREPKDRYIHSPINSKISLIITTKRVAKDLEFTIRKLCQQIGISHIEIIIIKFGSEDKNLNICNDCSIEILQNKESLFYTSETINKLIEAINGEYIVFISQDAFPIGNYWLYDLIIPLYCQEISAVVSTAIPHIKADLFNSWLYWYRHQILDFMKDTLLNKQSFKALTLMDEKSKTVLITLNNNPLCLKADLLRKYLSYSDYVDDLNLLLKLIKDGHSIMFQTSNAVIKSENGNALFYLKKSYTERLSLYKILEIPRNTEPLYALFGALCHLYLNLKKNINLLKDTSAKPSVVLGSLLSKLKEDKDESTFDLSSPEGHLDSFFFNHKPIKDELIIDRAYKLFTSKLESLSDYLLSLDLCLDTREDLAKCVYNIFSYVCGIFLAENSQEEIPSLRKEIFE